METSGHLVEQFEIAFQNCLSALTTQEHFNVSDSDEVKSSVDQNFNKFMSLARQLEACFLEKRQMFAYYKPEEILREEITELKQELARKEQLIARHHEKLQQWQGMMGSQPALAAGQHQSAGQGPSGQTSQGGGPLASLVKTTSSIN